MRVIFACAGTGGHINPAIAIANLIKEKYNNSEFLFIGTKNGLENKLVIQAGFKIKHIRTGKIIRSITFKNVKQLYNAYLGTFDTKRILKEFKPDLVIGTGGYICVPVMFAAKSLKVPYMLHESNSLPGVSVKLFAKNAKCVMVGFKETTEKLKYKENVVYTGSPAKFDKIKYDNLDVAVCKKKLGITTNKKYIVLVTCGSQGAVKINETLLELLKKYQDEDIYYILVTGDKNYDEICKEKSKVESQINKSLDEYIKLERFVFDMDKMYKISDLCVTRAGAMTVTELKLSNKKAILIPLPSAAENHQYYNAKVLENLGYGEILEQKKLSVETLHNLVRKMLEEKTINIHDEENLDVNNRIYECIKNALK